MGTYKQGIHGKFSGKVGNIVGSSWKGKGVMRILPASVSNPRTGKQLNQRSKFGMAIKLVHANGALVKSGFRPWANGMSAHNAAMSYNLAHAFTGEHPNVSIDFSRVLISRGDLAPVSNLTAVSTTPAYITLNWADNSAAQNARATDRLMASLYDSESGTAAIYPFAASRADGTAELASPAGWTGRSVQVLAFFIDEAAASGIENKQQVSDSVWGGTLELI